MGGQRLPAVEGEPADRTWRGEVLHLEIAEGQSATAIRLAEGRPVVWFGVGPPAVEVSGGGG